MRKRDALKLHNGDEVILKKTGDSLGEFFLILPRGEWWFNLQMMRIFS